MLSQKQKLHQKKSKSANKNVAAAFEHSNVELQMSALSSVALSSSRFPKGFPRVKTSKCQMMVDSNGLATKLNKDQSNLTKSNAVSEIPVQSNQPVSTWSPMTFHKKVE